MNKRSLIQATLLLSPLLLILSLAIFHHPNSYYNLRKRSLDEMRAVIARWAGKRYAPLIDLTSVKKVFGQVPIGGAPLTTEMRDAYSDAMANFLFAFKEGNVESWKRFRFDGLPGQLTSYGRFQVEFYYGLTNSTKPALPDYAPRDPDFLSRWKADRKAGIEVADTNLDGLFYKFLGEITYGTFYKGYFDGICVDEMIVVHDHYVSKPPPLDQYPFFRLDAGGGAGQVTATFPNLGYEVWENENPKFSFFAVHPTLTELLSSQGEVDCINTFVYIKINETGEVAPFLLRHVWNPNTKRWAVVTIVDALLSSYNRKMRVIAL